VAVGLDKGVLGGIGSDGKLSLVKIDKALVAAVQERQGERGTRHFNLYRTRPTWQVSAARNRAS
jgi:hypothetical protein